MTIYLDYGSATPVDERVLRFALPFLTNAGNPSALHAPALSARQALEDARKNVADLINAKKAQSIIFTSGATEANNLAIRGTALRNAAKGKRVVASAIEHMSVVNPMKDLQKNGFDFVYIPVDQTGLIDLDALEKALTLDTTVTAIMYANNEIGTIQPIHDVSKLVHEKGLYLHVDATAAARYLPIDVQALDVDLLTLSSNDLGGPQGAGALYIKPSVSIQPVIFGGGQERGLRSGTENIFAIAGMGEAARLAKKEMTQERARLGAIRDELIKQILEIDESYLTGHPTQRLPHHASFRFSRIEGESILLDMDMRGICISTGSACSSRTLEASPVLLAIGLTHEEAHGSMVLTLGPTTSAEHIPQIAEAAKTTVQRLRAMSPL